MKFFTRLTPAEAFTSIRGIFFLANLNACSEIVLLLNVVVVAARVLDFRSDTRGTLLTGKKFSVRRILAFRCCRCLISVARDACIRHSWFQQTAQKCQYHRFVRSRQIAEFYGRGLRQFFRDVCCLKVIERVAELIRLLKTI